jgi:hypothetical protein
LSQLDPPQRVQLDDYLVMERGEFIARDLGKDMTASSVP